MNWNDVALVAQQFLFYMTLTTVAGSMFVLVALIFERIPSWKNSCLHLVWMKIATLFYVLPIAAVLFFRMNLSEDGMKWLSSFGMVMTLPMRIVYSIAAGIWFGGLLCGVVVRIHEYHRLVVALRGNVPVEDDRCVELFEQYKTYYQLKRVEIYQNDLVEVPITVGILRPQIILPYRSYKEKELHMILRHEMHHVKALDLLWKRLNLLVTFLHWWNPFSYILLKRMVLRQEMTRDMEACVTNEYFTMAEYGAYLSGVEVTQKDRVFLSSLGSSKSEIVWRIEAMARGKKHKKWVAVVSCMVFSFVSVVPSYAAAEGIARVNEEWIEATEVEVEVEPIDWSSFEQTGLVTAEDDVVEVDLTTNGVQMISQLVELDATINPKHRVLYQWQYMEVGDTVYMVVQCADRFPVYRIGIRDSVGNLFYLEGTGKLDHRFTITTAGRYTVYVENMSNVAIDITGDAMYPD